MDIGDGGGKGWVIKMVVIRGVRGGGEIGEGMVERKGKRDGVVIERNSSSSSSGNLEVR